MLIYTGVMQMYWIDSSFIIGLNEGNDQGAGKW